MGEQKYSIDEILFEMALKDYTKDIIKNCEERNKEDQLVEQAIIQHKNEKYQKGKLLKVVALGYNGDLNGNK